MNRKNWIQERREHKQSRSDEWKGIREHLLREKKKVNAQIKKRREKGLFRKHLIEYRKMLIDQLKTLNKIHTPGSYRTGAERP